MDVTHEELHLPSTTAKLNWLRASVLGANDGIVSIAGLVVGVASVTSHTSIIFATGTAGIIAGAISMAAGEYVSVSSSRDTEKALLKKERLELETNPEAELKELIIMYQNKGLSKQTATLVSKELTEKDAFKAHVDAELHIDPDDLTNPWHAAVASAVSFFIGALIPMSAIIITPSSYKVSFTFSAVVIALILTGYISAKISGAHILQAILRVVTGGILAMAVTYGVGRIFGVSV